MLGAAMLEDKLPDVSKFCVKESNAQNEAARGDLHMLSTVLQGMLHPLATHR